MSTTGAERRAARLAAIAAAADLLVVAAFQAFLALGGRASSAAWGGAHRRLPARLRAGSALSSPALCGFAWAVLARAGHLRASPERPGVRRAVWGLVGAMALSAVANLASPSRWERYLMGPNAALIALLAAVVARDGRLGRR